MAIPTTKTNPYNEQIPGVVGLFGAGGGLQAFYLQATIKPRQLESISLISEISGSERWPIQDLFQRDVDNERITQKLLPFLREQNHIKFFNPLTLTVLPMDEDGFTVLKQMPKIEDESYEVSNQSWSAYERKRFFRISWVNDDDDDRYGKLEWNSNFAKLVAIDGQHRLSALKRYFKDEAYEGHSEFLTWRIPIVVVSFRAVDSNEPPSVLDVVRNIFVYINTEAQQVNDSRKILLSDNNINNICTQELIQEAHENDLKKKPTRSKVPLLFYDWRGEEINKEVISSLVAVKTVTEINNLISSYIIGDDERSSKQKVALSVFPDNRLNSAFVDKSRRLTYEQVRLVRKQFQENVLHAISYLLENFTPYGNYIEKLRALEDEQADYGDIGTHALSQLRFGTNMAIDDIRSDVDKRIVEFQKRVLEFKNTEIGELLQLDVGMRGVISAYGSIYEQMYTPKNWLDYTEWFVDALNGVFEDGWFDQENKRTSKYLHHVVYDHNQGVVNYRLDHAGNGLGAYVEILIYKYADDDTDEKLDWDQMYDSAINRLRNTILRGYKREVRVILKEHEDFADGGKKLTEAVNKEAAKRVKRHITQFEKELFSD